MAAGVAVTEYQTRLKQYLSNCVVDPDKDLPEDEIKPALSTRLLQLLCGVASKPERRLSKEEILELQKKATDIHEEPGTKMLLDLNAVLALSCCIFLHAFFA